MNRARRFLFLIDVLEKGGSQRQLLAVCEALIERGDQVTVAAFHAHPSPMREEFERTGARVLLLGKRGRFDPAFLGRLKTLVRDGDFDLVQSMAIQTSFWAARVMGGEKRRPAFVGAMLNCHRLRKGPFRIAERFAIAPCLDAIFVNSAAAARLYKRYVPTPPPIWCVPNGVEIPELGRRAEIRREFGLAEEDFAVVAVGRLSAVKRYDDLIEAASQLLHRGCPLKLILIGDGPERGALENRARDLGIADIVRFAGEMQNPVTLLEGFDALALPSESESSPNALLEGMAAGLACVAARVGGVKEIAEDGRTALLVPPREPAKLAEAILQLWQSPQRRRKIGRAARAAVARRFSMKRKTERLLARYDNLIETYRLPVAYVMPIFPKLSEAFVMREVTEMRRRELLSTVVTLKPPFEKTIHREARRVQTYTVGLPWISLPVLWENLAMLAQHPWLTMSTFLQIVWMHRVNGIELGKMIGVWPKLPAFARILRRRGIRHVHTHWANAPAACGWAIARLARTTFSFTAHAHDIYRHQLALDRKIRLADFVATCTQRNVDHLSTLVEPHHAAKIHLVRHFLGDLPDYREVQPEDPPVIISVGSLMSYKGFDLLLRAAALLRDQGHPFRLVIIGGGRDEAELKALARELDLDGIVEFTGQLPQEEVFRRLAGASICCLASRATESGSEDNLPNVLVEGALFHLPVVTTRVGSILEFVCDDSVGYAVEPNSHEALAKPLGYLLEHPEWRRELGDRIAVRAAEMFQRDRHAETLAREFHKVLNRRTRNLIR